MVKNDFNPKVSIVIPVYNGSNYLKEAIDSALAQTYNNIEIIVVNDGSSDEGLTEKIAKSYGEKIRYYKKQNGGVASALNFGIKQMTGDYFSWLSHDDKYVPERTKKMVNSISSEVELQNLMVATSYTYFNESATWSPPRPKEYTPTHPLSFLFLGYINGCSVLVPKQMLLKENAFNEKLPTTQDTDLWFRLLRKNKLVYLEEELTLSRSHIEQGSKAMISSHVDECNELWIGIMEKLSSIEKKKIFGDELNFYNAIYDFLKNNTLYNKAIFHAKVKMLKLIKNKIYEEEFKPEFIENWSLNIRKGKKTLFFPLFGNYSDRGGLNKMVSMVANQFSRKYNVIIASFTAKDGGYYLNSDVTFVHVSTDFLGVDSFESISILFDVDITIISHNCSSKGLELINRIKSNKQKVIAWNHEDYFLLYISLKYSEVWPIRNDTLAKVDAVLWPTNASCAAYSLRANNAVVMPNFVHFVDSSIRQKQGEVHNNIIAAARFDDPRKRIELLLNCYEKIIKLVEDIELTILGVIDFDMPYINGETIGAAIARINSKGGKIKLTGFVNDIGKYYSKSDINILPSYGEGFGLTILESSYYGVPTAVFDNSGFSDIISEGINGIIAPEADVDVLSRRIADLFKNKKKLIEMKKSAKEIIKQFDEKKITSEWETLIENIIFDKKVNFNKYDYNRIMIQKISNGYENSLTELSKQFDYRKMISLENENLRLNKDKDAIYNSKRWKYSAKLAEIKYKLLK